MADLKDLDGNALVARLGAVKKRALRHADMQFDSELADTQSVLEECAVRLLGSDAPDARDARGIAEGWQAGARKALLAATVALDEVERLRGLIRAVVDVQARLAVKTGCPGCAAHGAHEADCPWLPLAAEATRK
jgi:hypothetical protein